jgi:hypothetical protein
MSYRLRPSYHSSITHRSQIGIRPLRRRALSRNWRYCTRDSELRSQHSPPTRLPLTTAIRSHFNPKRAPPTWLNTVSCRDMSNPMSETPYGLLTMPTELRLDVYRYLFEDCLADGYVSDIVGLLLCCRGISSRARGGAHGKGSTAIDHEIQVGVNQFQG